MNSTNARVLVRFVDTNVLLYAVTDESFEPTKRHAAIAVLSADDLVLSAQVLQEFYAQATRPGRPDRLTAAQADGMVRSFARFPVIPGTLELVLAAIASSQRFRISYWDAAIIEAARAGRCTEILSEDLSDGQDYGGVHVRNPFL